MKSIETFTMTDGQVNALLATLPAAAVVTRHPTSLNVGSAKVASIITGTKMLRSGLWIIRAPEGLIDATLLPRTTQAAGSIHHG